MTFSKMQFPLCKPTALSISFSKYMSAPSRHMPDSLSVTTQLCEEDGEEGGEREGGR